MANRASDLQSQFAESERKLNETIKSLGKKATECQNLSIAKETALQSEKKSSAETTKLNAEAETAFTSHEEEFRKLEYQITVEKCIWSSYVAVLKQCSVTHILRSKIKKTNYPQRTPNLPNWQAWRSNSSDRRLIGCYWKSPGSEMFSQVPPSLAFPAQATRQKIGLGVAADWLVEELNSRLVCGNHAARGPNPHFQRRQGQHTCREHVWISRRTPSPRPNCPYIRTRGFRDCCQDGQGDPNYEPAVVTYAVHACVVLLNSDTWQKYCP